MRDSSPRLVLNALALALGLSLAGCASRPPGAEQPAALPDAVWPDRDSADTTEDARAQDSRSPASRENRAWSRPRASAARTASSSATDPLKLSRLPLDALIAEGDRLHAQGQCKTALPYFEAAVSQPGGLQAGALNGVYLCQLQLDRQPAAEATFGRIVALGLASGKLPLKLLFQPGSTDYLAEPGISGAYRMWLRQIARASQAARVCLSVTGHGGPSERERRDERLTLLRAQAVQRQLENLAPALRGRLDAVGIGARENFVGSGTDDLRDALDRRVEFRPRPCPEPGGS